MEKEEPELLKIKMDYAWNWYSYHANQRMIAFRFFLIIIGILIIGLLQVINSNPQQINLCALISFSGVVISLSFWSLDIRNYELVLYASSDLKNLENKVGLRISGNEEKRECFKESINSIRDSKKIKNFVNKFNYIFKHKFIIRKLYLFSTILFIITFVYFLRWP